MDEKLREMIAEKVLEAVEKAIPSSEEKGNEEEDGEKTPNTEEIVKVVLDKVNEHPLFKAIQIREEKEEEQEQTGLSDKDVAKIGEMAAQAAVSTVTELFGGKEQLEVLRRLRFVRSSEMGGRTVVALDADQEFAKNAGFADKEEETPSEEYISEDEMKKRGISKTEVQLTKAIGDFARNPGQTVSK